ncbi:Ig-like domain-containing protein [Flavobacterium degerlachei]|jgi:hypothetical protein|uniref:Glycosyl hydrolase family 16 n=1 Tax=Flavobacterium degerlachei TaxID=229203 RepID=A0A1H2T303_9FLAO|nr:hypothetical protein [Flavobacterium degerlachei]SDW38326.1 hypothetical protein SAMN05444338_102249 [Flavobacterium degerlachei]
MKNRKYTYLTNSFILGLFLVASVSCERELSDETKFATFPNTAEVFIDGFTGGLDYFPFSGSKADAFTVDTKESYKGASSMRFDVPNVGDPDGAFAGAIFRLASERDLTTYDALTFWAKGTVPGLINEIGFGQDFGENKYLVTTNLQLTTNWKKYTIAIPDASKLIAEKGMFWYAEGPEDNKGYTFWIDELKFEKLGTIAQPRPSIVNGLDKVETQFLGNSVSMAAYGLTQTFNLESGVNQTVTAAPAYFSFKSSNTDVARVSDAGIVTLVGTGTSKITATLGNVKATGSLTVNVPGSFPVAPVPTLAQNNVVSIFSDKYTNVPVNYYNGYWAPYQTTKGEQTIINGQNVINYTDFNFVGTQLTTPLDISQMTHFSVDIMMLELPTDIDLLLTFKNENSTATTFQQNRIGQSYQLDSRAPVVYPSADFKAGVWSTIKIPIRPTSETSLDKTGVNLIIIENIKSSNVKTIYLDNMYFYKE